MNYAHLHLIINHFPIVGNVIGTMLLIWSLIKKKKELVQLSLLFTILIAISGYVSDFTGNKAEEEVSDLPGITRTAIHEHEEAADLSLTLLYGTGGVALITLVLYVRNKKPVKIFLYLTLFLSLVTAFFLSRTGYLGGMIRHPEISRAIH